MFNLLGGSVRKEKVYSMISFVTPVYNEEKRISQCITNLFRYAAQYPGFSEIIIVDDGSTDYTYEVAWAAIELSRKEWPRVGGKIVRHSTSLGREEAIRTGANRALGSVVAVIDTDSCLGPVIVNDLIPIGRFLSASRMRPSNGKRESNKRRGPDDRMGSETQSLKHRVVAVTPVRKGDE
jgi:glycosyltransferase involved in cell wall biosynthesis